MRLSASACSVATALTMLVACGACGSSKSAPSSSTDAGASADADADPTVFGGNRPVTLHVPASYASSVATPLVILLHGYGGSGSFQDLYFGLTAVSDARGFLYAAPDGTVDADGRRFWNATDGCCDLHGTNVDDSTYISSLIKEIQGRFNVDAKRIFLVGHSNGGFMSYRMACDHADQIAAIASLAGAMFSDVTKCAPSGPVNILQIHGTADGTIAFDGGTFHGATTYPSAKTTVADWVTFDGCSGTADTSAPPLDLDTRLAGSETTVTTYAAGCKPGGSAALWTIAGGSHIPSLTASFSTAVIDYLFAHPKP